MIEVRDVGINDATAETLWREAREALGLDYYPLELMHGHEAHIAFVGNVPAGVSVFWPRPGSDTVEGRVVYVLPQYREQGVWQAMLRFKYDAMKARGYTHWHTVALGSAERMRALLSQEDAEIVSITYRRIIV